MRSLSPDEAELWARVTATTRPLSREPQADEKPPAAGPPVPPPAPTAPLPRPAKISAPRKRRPVTPIKPQLGTTLDGSWDRKLGSGALVPDRVLDLHGLDLDRAWHAIDSALEGAIAADDRVVLLITGHERSGEPPIQRGRIRAAVRDWLAASRHAPAIAAVRGAHRRHGGAGSLYIVLRRAR